MQKPVRKSDYLAWLETKDPALFWAELRQLHSYHGTLMFYSDTVDGEYFSVVENPRTGQRWKHNLETDQRTPISSIEPMSATIYDPSKDVYNPYKFFPDWK